MKNIFFAMMLISLVATIAIIVDDRVHPIPIYNKDTTRLDATKAVHDCDSIANIDSENRLKVSKENLNLMVNNRILTQLVDQQTIQIKEQNSKIHTLYVYINNCDKEVNKIVNQLTDVQKLNFRYTHRKNTINITYNGKDTTITRYPDMYSYTLTQGKDTVNAGGACYFINLKGKKVNKDSVVHNTYWSNGNGAIAN